MPHIEPRLFADDNPLASRQPKTDRLILDRLLTEESLNRQLDSDAIDDAHQIIIRWADLETSGRLATLTETQLQGDFLAEIFGQILGYTRAVENDQAWQLEQHHTINGTTPDAILGQFEQNKKRKPLAVIELKGPSIHLDRDRSNGRTAVDQCWDYLVNTPPTCRWGIVSNMVSFRLYERDSTKRTYEHFSLQSLRDMRQFRKFYVLFHRKGLIEKTAGVPPRAIQLLERTNKRQREVSDVLYETYSKNRTSLIAHLHFELNYPVDDAIEMAQRLFDRIMFIAFCEDRGLLRGNTIATACQQLPGFSPVTNPRWQQFKTLFRFIDTGSDQHNIPPYNGGLFAPHPVDELDLPDEPWTNFFQTVGSYDFSDEVNLDVLGHLFEKSITELEKQKASGFFGGDIQRAEEYAEMPQSAKRKQLGIYYTPPELTSRIVHYTIEELIIARFAQLAIEHGITPDDAARGDLPDTPEYWQGCLTILRELKIVDPACGSGAFLFQAYDALEHRYGEVIGALYRHGDPDADTHADRLAQYILNENLYGVDLSPEAVEITQLALWIRSATRDQKLQTLSRNIVHGNSLIHDPEVHPAGFAWEQRFPEVFDRPGYRDAGGGFDCVIGNPPWERMDLAEREFFSLPAPEIATATTGAKREMLIRKLEQQNPELHALYTQTKLSIDKQRKYCRSSGCYPLTGKGRTNTYAVFSELAKRLLAPHGRVGLLTPSGIASDKTTKDFFAAITDTDRLIRLYDFENRTKKFFPDVDGRFKFCILNYGGAAERHDQADFVFFAHHVEDLENPDRRIQLSGEDIKLLNPNTRTCPIFRSKRDAEITKAIYRRVPVLIDKNRRGKTGNPWGIKFKQGLFNQTTDSKLFKEAEFLQDKGFKLDGNRWSKGKKTYLPVYEAKMVQMYDHRAADILTESNNWVRQGQTSQLSITDHQNPEHMVMPRYWVDRKELDKDGSDISHFLCFKDVTSPTNQRTMIASLIPRAGVVNSAPIIFTETGINKELCLLANLNSFIYDYVVRQKISNLHLNFFIIEQVPSLAPPVYNRRCPWSRDETLESWIGERVLKLSCTAEDMLPLAEACDFQGGSFAEYDGRLNRWDEAERVELMAELDAAYFLLYQISREDAEYILSTFKGIHQDNPLLPGHPSTAEYILETYDRLS